MSDRNNATHRSITIRRAVLAALGAASVGTCLPVATANAQAAPVELEEVVVTGSILKRTDIETASPVSVVTAESLEERGINTISEAIQRLPSNNAGTIQQGWNTGWNFASGANAPALRGLTVQATLSVADGLRLAPYPLADDGQRNFVDLNAIPSAIVERIEVLRDGASSTYGADAIAGVVNLITKKEIQGFDIGMSYGDSQEGGAEETALNATWGIGSLADDGYNFYVSSEYKKQGILRASDRGYPFNTADLTGKCHSSGTCMDNHNWNGLTPERGEDGFNGLFSIPGVTLVRPVLDDVATSGSGRYEFLNPTAGCRNWDSVSITEDMSSTSPLTSCEVDYRNAYLQLQPEIERIGLTLRFTANVGDNAQLYAMGNYYKADSFASITPLGFNGLPPPPRPATLTSYNVLLPVYVCSTGVGTQSGLDTGCDETNGQLNPYNPYAAEGLRAQALFRSPYGRTIDTSSRSLRFALGLDGEYGDGWRYSANLTASEVGLTRIQSNYYIPQRIMDVVARGSFNFDDPTATPQEVWDYIDPDNRQYSVSRLWQAQALVAKDLMDLSGGPLQGALGLAYREESITAPSGNPANDSAPFTRYYSVNAVGTAGSRDVTSAFFEINAPVLQSLELMASGRFDDYSSGQSNFSPKLGIKWTPIESLILRGTWSEGFRIPSFNEAYGLPTTGYVTRSVDCAVYVDFCAAHGNESAYYTNYSLGLTQTGDPELDPEESTSFTAGIVWQPLDSLSINVDYWEIKVENLIVGVTDTSEAEDQYYSNNGVVNIPGITVLPGTPDGAYPNALPVLGFIQSSYANQDEQTVSGIDIGIVYSMPIGSVGWTSTFDASWLQEYQLKTDAGTVSNYEGTLSPCNVTSCSGAPEWRASWQNTFQISDTAVTLTAYYTQGVDNASVDYGGVPGDCEASIGASVLTYADDVTPVNCKSGDIWNLDLTVRHQFNEQITLFADVLNVLDIEPEFDPSAAYGLFNFNPAWAGQNILGRYFRVGAKFQF